jgi:hypothetical protein
MERDPNFEKTGQTLLGSPYCIGVFELRGAPVLLLEYHLRIASPVAPLSCNNGREGICSVTTLWDKSHYVSSLTLSFP